VNVTCAGYIVEIGLMTGMDDKLSKAHAEIYGGSEDDRK
jgi:hypothetical protein